MMCPQCGRMLDRLTEIEAAIAALYRERGEIGAALEEHELEAAPAKPAPVTGA